MTYDYDYDLYDYYAVVWLIHIIHIISHFLDMNSQLNHIILMTHFYFCFPFPLLEYCVSLIDGMWIKYD